MSKRNSRQVDFLLANDRMISLKTDEEALMKMGSRETSRNEYIDLDFKTDSDGNGDEYSWLNGKGRSSNLIY